MTLDVSKDEAHRKEKEKIERISHFSELNDDAKPAQTGQDHVTKQSH